ncbi:transglutaminaseTgpA domain-containing protein, partial [Ilumatobacter sp.]|uniref:transglutaminase family protein n=1 Tax=Ilumatobacter sp. TaxID=1967498 RepID=UPI003C5E1616
RLPGADAEPIYETRGGGSSSSVTEVISPLVDIRSRLTNRETVELFTVQATEASYWRSAALGDFDGTRWRIPESALTAADGTVGAGIPGSVEIRQDITIAALGGVFVPAAADPVVIEGEGELNGELRWSDENATLVKSGDDLEAGDRVTVSSASPRLSPATLAAATSVAPEDPLYADLPSDFPSSVRAITLDVTAGATSSYEAALMLQDWMRDPEEFTYSLEVQEGHGNSAIESFLRNRVGYCEQFAGTYAAMLRTIGIPTRVAVGFTQGEDGGTGLYSVLGRNAHAWPEVWFDDIGWVPFEPTPGRGAPGTASYTGREPEQAEPVPDADQSAPETAPPVTTPVTTIVTGGAPGPTTIPAGIDPADDPAANEAVPTAAVPDDGMSVPWVPLGILTLIGLLVALPAVIRRIRRSAISSSGAQLAHLWSRAIDALRSTGLDDTTSRTPEETAEAASRVFPVSSRPMHALAQVVTYVNFAPDGAEHLSDTGQYGVSLLENCSQWVRQVERAVTDSLTPAERARRYFTHLG